MTQFLTPISRAHYNSFFRIGQSSIPFPEISRSNSGYILDVSQPSILSSIVKNHLLYPGDFLFINASEFHFLNDYDVSLILNFLSSLNDIDWYLCIEYTDISTSFFEGDNDVYMSPIYPLSLRNSNGLFHSIHTYPIDYSGYNEYSTIMQFIADLDPVKVRIPLSLIYNFQNLP